MSEKRLLRKMRLGFANSAGYPQPWTPQDEQDGKRERLTEELLKIAVEELSTGNFTDSSNEEEIPGKDGERGWTEERNAVTVEEWMVKLAKACLSAAEVVYPDLPEINSEKPQ